MINTMKLRFLFLLTTLSLGLCSNAQNYKFGKVSKEELAQQNHPEFNVKIIDISNRDFIKNRVDYLWILEQICA